MSRHILLGYGYVASHLAELLIQQNQEVISVCRQIPAYVPPQIKHLTQDICQTPVDIQQQDTLYYFIPPLGEYEDDVIITDFLKILTQAPKKVIYIGSSGIYGHHHGEWVDEQSPCHIKTIRQKQRLSAESQFEDFCQKHHIACARLRVAGIYGPQRVPIDAVYAQTPVIHPKEAPLINHIYIKDLTNILAYLGNEVTFHGILNIADGTPSPMGALQQQLAQVLKFPLAPNDSFENIWNTASSMKKEFISQNKKLSVERLLQILNPSPLQLTPLPQALKEIIEAQQF